TPLRRALAPSPTRRSSDLHLVQAEPAAEGVGELAVADGAGHRVHRSRVDPLFLQAGANLVEIRHTKPHHRADRPREPTPLEHGPDPIRLPNPAGPGAPAAAASTLPASGTPLPPCRPVSRAAQRG